MIDRSATGEASGAAWLRFLPAFAAVAALVAYGFLEAFPAVRQPPVPPAAPLAAAAFAALQLLLPSVRPTRAQLVSPLNWALLAFLLQLVAMPLLISWAGPAPGVLQALPSLRAIDQSIGLSVLAFAAFSLGCAVAARTGRPGAAADEVRVTASVVVLYAGLGVAGLLLRFGALGEVFATLADPTRLADVADEQAGTLRGAASTFLRPFLLTAIVMAWCAWLDRRRADAPRALRHALTAATACGVLVVGATYGLNRAAFMVPLVAMAAASSAHARRLSARALAIAGLLLVVLAILPQQYRAGHSTASELARSRSAREQVFVADNLGTELQVYGAAPQFAGFVLEAAERRREPFPPSVLLASALSPVPIVGKHFRDRSGPVTYNRLIYGNIGVVDQIFPFEAEVWLCLGPAGLAAAFLLVGFVIGRLQRAFDRASTAFDSYALQFTAMWVTFLVQGSLAAVSQVFVFFLWPIYGWVLLRHVLVSRAARGRAPDAVAA